MVGFNDPIWRYSMRLTILLASVAALALAGPSATTAQEPQPQQEEVVVGGDQVAQRFIRSVLIERRFCLL